MQQPLPFPLSFIGSLTPIITHTLLTSLAVGIALALPTVAWYILYYWWPHVKANSELLLVSEITFAAALLMLFNLSRVTWIHWRRGRLNGVAALVHASDEHRWLVNWGMNRRRVQPKATRDIHILSMTGREVFHAGNHALRQLLEACYEVRVLLLDPEGRP